MDLDHQSGIQFAAKYDHKVNLYSCYNMMKKSVEDRHAQFTLEPNLCGESLKGERRTIQEFLIP